MSLDAAIDALGRVAAEIEQLPKLIHRGGKPTSQRAIERRQIRSASGGGGVARAALLDELPGPCLIMCGHSVLLIRAVADCLIVARTRGNRVNTPALALATRALLETAARVAWLVDSSIDGTTRARRYLAWRFSDLQSDRSLLSGMDEDRPDVAAARAAFEAREAELIKQTTAAKWQTRPSRLTGGGERQAAALLQMGSDKVHAHAKMNDMVHAMIPGDAYQLLSVAAHGNYSGLLVGTIEQSEPDETGGVTVAMAGFGVSPGMAVITVCNAVTASTRRLAIWNGVGTERLDKELSSLVLAVGRPVAHA